MATICNKGVLWTPIVCLLALYGQHAQAVSLTGLLGIDAGTRTAGVYSGGSYFAMNSANPNGSSVAMLTAGSAGGILLGTYQNFVTDPDVPHPANWDGAGALAGTGYTQLVTQGSAFNPFNFFGKSTYIGLNPVSYQSGVSKLAPSADVDLNDCTGTVCSMTADLSAWEVYWNGSVFEQGPRPVNTGPFTLATGMYDTATGKYSLDWASQINGGPFNGVGGYWHIEGTHVVPAPGALFLFGSGLACLMGVIKRKHRIA